MKVIWHVFAKSLIVGSMSKVDCQKKVQPHDLIDRKVSVRYDLLVIVMKNSNLTQFFVKYSVTLKLLSTKHSVASSLTHSFSSILSPFVDRGQFSMNNAPWQRHAIISADGPLWNMSINVIDVLVKDQWTYFSINALHYQGTDLPMMSMVLNAEKKKYIHISLKSV